MVDISELKKIVLGAGAIAALVRAVANNQPVWTSAIAKLPFLIPLSELKVAEVFPELLDLSKDECVELVGSFYIGFK